MKRTIKKSQLRRLVESVINESIAQASPILELFFEKYGDKVFIRYQGKFYERPKDDDEFVGEIGDPLSSYALVIADAIENRQIEPIDTTQDSKDLLTYLFDKCIERDFNIDVLRKSEAYQNESLNRYLVNSITESVIRRLRRY